MKKFLLCALCLSALSVQAGELRAIVNDAPIFDRDIILHGRLLKAQQPAVFADMSEEKLNQIATDNLIENTLKIQKGASLNFSLSERDIDEAVIHLEQQNGFSAGGLQRLLAEQNVPMKTLRQQVYGDLVWLTYVRSRAGHITIPSSAVEQRLKKIDVNKASGV